MRDHGFNRYRYDKCRCPVCKTAYSDKQAEYRRNRMAKIERGELVVRHGTQYSYANGCRCDDCKTAASDYRAAWLYGDDLTPRPKLCEMCSLDKPLFMDHDHDSGQFRGWLCTQCNTGLGKLGDSIEGLERAIAYLRK